MKKIILLILVCFLCSCDIDYTININKNNNINQLITAEEPNMDKDETKTLIFENNFGYFQNKYPKYDFFSDYYNDIYTVIYEYDYDIKHIEKEISSYKEIVEYINYSGTINKKISAKIKDSFFEEYEFNNFNINIKIPYEVINSNSNNNKDNIYTWNINKDNSLIEIEYSTLKNKEKKTTNELLTIGIIITLSLIFIGIISIIVIMLKKGR